MKIQVVSQASKTEMEEGRVEKFQRCSRKCWKLFECRFHGRGNRGNGRKERNAETNFRPSSNRPWWSDKHRKRWVYHLRSYPLKSSFHPSLSLYPSVSFSPRNEGEISLYSFFRPTIDHTRQGDPEFSSKLQLQFLRFLRFFEFRVDRDFNIESPRDILEMEYSGLFRTCINARYIGNKNVWESRIKFFREFKASLSSRCRELRNLFKVQFQEWYTWQ